MVKFDKPKIVSVPGLKHKVGDMVWIVNHDSANGRHTILSINEYAPKKYYYSTTRGVYAIYEENCAPDGKLSELLYGKA